MFSTSTPSLFPFSAIWSLCIGRVARYTPFLQRQADKKMKYIVSIRAEHLLRRCNDEQTNRLTNAIDRANELVVALNAAPSQTCEE